MDWVVIEGIKPYDGRYEFDIAEREFNTREWGWIKRHSGYLPLTVDAGFEGGDPELFTVFAIIALHRAGTVAAPDVPSVFERFAEAPFGAAIRFESDATEEGDANPPPPNSNGSANTSGPASPTSSETSEAHPSGSGIHASATSESAPGE